MPSTTKQPTEKSGQEKARLSALRKVMAGWLFACKDSFTAFEVAIKLFTSYEAAGVEMGKFSDEVTDVYEIGRLYHLINNRVSDRSLKQFVDI